ncbi:MAG: hypothetical protein QNJ97_22655 [Myxococcota bacterium]|nr:hypothetical protein [Myxococcota bacterium]
MSGMINTLEQLWQAAIGYQKEKVFDSTAMYEINQRMSARLGYDDMANVFSGVYADTYWVDTYMDPSILAKHMVQGIGIDLSLATQYANAAMSLWRGMLTRKNFGDQGQIPCNGTTTNCPDIVCNQDTPLPSTDQLIKNWNTEFWKIPQDSKNYVYTRCQNLNFLGDITPTVEMFYSDAGFNSPPESWIQLYTANDPANPQGQINLIGGKPGPMAEGVRGASEAFMFEPKSTRHFCLIATVSSEFFKKNDPLKHHSNWNSATWLTHNGAAAWHNVDPQRNTDMVLKFYNQDATPEHFAFKAYCRNVPDGTVVSLGSKDKNGVSFQSGPVKISRPFQTVGAQAMIPPHFKGDLNVRIEGPKDKLLPPQASVEVQMLWILPSGHKSYHPAANMLKVVSASNVGQNIEVPMGSFTFVGAAKP